MQASDSVDFRPAVSPQQTQVTSLPQKQQENLGKLFNLINKHDSTKELKDFDFANPSSESMQQLISKSNGLIHKLLLEGNDTAAVKMQVRLNNVLHPNAQKNAIFNDVNIFERRATSKAPPNPLFNIGWKSQFELENLLKEYDINECSIDGSLNAGAVMHVTLANEEFVKALNLSYCGKGKLDCSIRDSEGKTCLIVGAKVLAPFNFMRNFLNGHPQDLDAQDNSGATALHYASLYGNVDIVDLLIQKGANPNVKDNAGLTPLDWVKQKTEEDVMNCMRSISLEPLRDSKAKFNSLNYEDVINTKENLKALLERPPSNFDAANPNDYSGISLVQSCMARRPEVLEYLEKLSV